MSRTRVIPFLATCILLLATSCTQSPAAPAAAGMHSNVVLEFGVNHPQHIMWSGAERHGGTVTVRENFNVFCWPYTATATAQRDGDVLVLRLTGQPVDGCPQDLAASISYRATVTLTDGFQPAAVRVEHRWSDQPARQEDRTLHF